MLFYRCLLRLQRHHHHYHHSFVRHYYYATQRRCTLTPYFPPTIQQRLDDAVKRHSEILQLMQQESSSSSNNSNNNTNMMKELSSISEIVSLYKQYQNLIDERLSYSDILQDAIASHDFSVQQDCYYEIERLQNDTLLVEDQIMNEILPKDEDDINHDAIIEIRAGTGGEEASLFAREIWDCYISTVKTVHKSWTVDILTESTSDLGGIKEGSFLVSGSSTSIEFISDVVRTKSFKGYNMKVDDYHPETKSMPTSHTETMNAATNNKNNPPTTTMELGPYGYYKFESGVHRVQRIPINSTRIHTSACSIAVLPSIRTDTTSNTNNNILPMSELKIETMRASGAGGQHVNTTDSAVRITHIPTGIQASIQDERSQHKNKTKALQLITARVNDIRRQELDKQIGIQRSKLMGGGDRSERIRTYNYPQDRITDHRCKVSFFNISSLFTNGHNKDGLVISFLPYLQMMRRQELLQQLEDEK